MSPSQSAVIGTYAAIVAVWPIRHVLLVWIARKCDLLTLRAPRYEGTDPPLVSAIVPARDEQGDLADCLATVRSQTYPNLEILVVDDRSTDRTGAIAEAIAREDWRVRVLRIDALPPGWTGKTHALHVASGAARGSWFWFIDADTRHDPDSLSIVMEYARRKQASLASLVPEMRCETFWERVVQPLMGIVLMRSFPPMLVNRGSSRVAFANGQYLLVHRPAYEEVGGHRSVRDRFVEDIYLARLLKARGYRIRVAMGPEISSTRMYTSLPGLVRGWSRILYDALGRRPLPLVGKIVEPLIFSQTFVPAMAAALALMAAGDHGPFPSWLLILSVCHLLLQISVLYRMYRMTSPATARAAVWYPLAGLVSDWILLKSIALCLTGRVTWRGTSYGPEAIAEPPPVAEPVAQG